MILRETQNQNDADDANDAESGIWYRDILKTASLASSASLSSHKSSEGVWGTPQKCVCGYPNAMLAKHICHQNGGNQIRPQYKFGYYLEWIDHWFTKTFDLSEWITCDSSKNLDSKKWISSDSLRKKIEEIIVLSRKSLLWNPKAQQEYPKTRQNMSNRIVQM